MKKLFHQMIKFGLVGVICFVIDYITGLIVLNVLMALFTDAWFEKASMIGSAAGFIVSVIVNYILSFKFVFERKQELNRRTEFIVFVILSVIGLMINSFMIWIAELSKSIMTDMKAKLLTEINQANWINIMISSNRNFLSEVRMSALCMSSFFLRGIQISVPTQILINTSNPKGLSR